MQSVQAPIRVHGKKFYSKIIPINARLWQASVFKQPGGMPTLWYDPNYRYRIGASDVLRIIVWGHPELSEPRALSQMGADVTAGVGSVASAGVSNVASGILVNHKGDIFFPYVGVAHVAGLGVEQVRQLISQRLSHYVRKPQVSVRVSSFRSQLVHVIGAVQHPGNVPLIDKPLSVLDAIANAGGVDSTTADLSHVFIVRGSFFHPQLFLLDAKSPSNLLLSERFKLLAHDIIYVPSAGISNWNQLINSLLPTLTTVTYTHALLHH